MLNPLSRTLVTPFRTAVAAGLLIVLTGCGLSSSSGGSDPTTDPTTGTTKERATGSAAASAPAPAPRSDTCHELTFGQIGRYANSSAPVPCAKPHTSYTFAVQQLPSDVAFKGVDIGNDAVQEKASLQCRSAYASYVGGSAAVRSLSRLSVTYFLPSQPDFDKGARWVRCDVIGLQSSRVLADLPLELKGFNTRDTALDDYGLCSQGDPGTTGAMLVMCSQDHTFRALSALRLGADSDAYPGESVAMTDGQKRCDKLVSDTLGVGGGYSYAWTYPSADDWANGQRFGFCWNKTGS
ncbi:MAG: septum formation family protein [Nocardioidaceae bacterium]